jgi:hypothetical protein
VIGGQAFIPSDGVTCSGGTASGTGTLVAVEGKKDIFMDIEPIIQSGGYVKIFAYAPAANPINDSSTVRVILEKPTQLLRLSDDQNIDSISDNQPSVFCLEFYGPPVNRLRRRGAICQLSNQNPQVPFTGNYDDTLRTWGFELNNASLGTVRFYPNGQLSL